MPEEVILKEIIPKDEKTSKIKSHIIKIKRKLRQKSIEHYIFIDKNLNYQ